MEEELDGPMLSPTYDLNWSRRQGDKVAASTSDRNDVLGDVIEVSNRECS